MIKVSNRTADKIEELRLFAGERLLVMISIFGFVLAVGVAVYIGIYGAVILPEGNLERAFSFNAALALFNLSIAAILPLAGLSSQKRMIFRWVFIVSSLYAYLVETIQHFRGINPRFSRVGSVADSIVGALFGLDSLLILILVVLLAISFYRKRQLKTRPFLVIGIRYGFFSTMLAFAAGLWMIALQSRYTGEAGNIIVLHGLGFHALQTLPLLGWLAERAVDKTYALRLLHFGSLSWTMSILLIGLQTILGRSVFEPTVLPLLACVLLLIWLVTVIAAALNLRRLAVSAHSSYNK